MNTHTAITENPFATRYTRPGAIPFLFSAEDSAESIVAQFVAVGRRGAIVGPHGSGKSTLLETLLPQLRATDMNPLCHTLHDGQCRLASGFVSPTTNRDVLIIDGYEQLSWWGRREVAKAVRRAAAGLLVTAHAPRKTLPTIYRTEPTYDAACRVVRRLLPSMPAAPLADDDVCRLYEQSQGNLRELFFKLYDLYESQRS